MTHKLPENCPLNEESEEHGHIREIDRWLKWAAILGPVFGFLFGICAGALGAYQAYKNDSNRIVLLEGWKDKQEDFNRETIAAIARLKALVKDVQQ